MRLLFAAAAIILAADLPLSAPARADGVLQLFYCTQAPASKTFGRGDKAYHHYIYTIDNKDNLTITDKRTQKAKKVKIIGGGASEINGAPAMKWLTKTHEYDLRWDDSIKEFAFSAIPQNGAEPEIGVCFMRQEGGDSQ